MKAWLATVAGCTFLASSLTGAVAETDPARYPMPPGFHTDRNGCYVRNVPGPAIRPHYVLQRHDVAAAIAEYRIAAATPRTVGSQPSYHDLVTRLPLSVLLYRAGRVTEARGEWRTMLSNRIADAKKFGTATPDQPPALRYLAQRRLDMLAEREIPGGWAGFYGTGAGQHVARGFQAAKRGDVARAAAEWRCAAKASPEFEAPHLMLGYVAVLGGDIRTAKREWIATLEGFQSEPGDMMSITAWQFDAMEALLRYS